MSSLQSPAHIACIALLALLFFPPHRLVRQNPRSSAYPDNSDWWSGLNSSGSDEVVNIQERELPPATFRILGIGLSEEMFRRTAAKLGKTQIIERGDASTGRSQACYVSSKGSPKTFLIFEQGEVDFGFYLFSDSRPWNGMDRCTPSAFVSDEISIASGLHLGQVARRGHRHPWQAVSPQQGRTPLFPPRQEEKLPRRPQARSPNQPQHERH